MIEIASLKDLKALEKVFDPAHIKKAIKLANSKTAQKTRTFISKKVRETYNVKAKDIAANSSIKRQTGDNSDVLLFYQGRRLSLMYFDARQVQNVGGAAVTTYRAKNGLAARRAKRKSRKTGVSVKIRKDKGRESVTGLRRFGGYSPDNPAFIGQGRRGKSGGGFGRRLFNANTQKDGRGNVQVFVREGDGRLPVRKLTGPSIPQMVGGKDVLKKSFEFIEKEHTEQFSHHLEKLHEGIIK